MHGTRRFSIDDLRGIFYSVLERYAGTVGVYLYQGEELAVLADQLDMITSSVDVSDNLNAMAHIMTAVTERVFWGAPIIPVPAADRTVNALKWKLCTELSIECAAYFAQLHGYPIRAAQIDHDQCCHIMQMHNNWAELTAMFQDSLIKASIASDLLGVEGDDPMGNSRGTGSTGRQLSAESYANLRSVAYARRWNDSEILMLIEQHLRPQLNPYALHYSDTVSGDEWLYLYNWILRRDGQSS
jgi:hypothetical protein